MRKIDIPRPVLESLEKNRIDIDASLRILNNWNEGRYRNVRPVVVRDLPSIDGKRILDMTRLQSYSFPLGEARKNLRAVHPGLDPADFGEKTGDGGITLPRGGLEKLGVLLYPLLSYGILNGGSATSYSDLKRNKSLDEDLFRRIEPAFTRSARLCRDRPKGITPAYGNPDGSPGRSFIELKMRALLLGALRFRSAASILRPPAGSISAAGPFPLAPMFQMTSVFTDAEVAEAYRGYPESPLLKRLIGETGIDITRVETGVQPLIAAFSHSSAGEKKTFFTNAGGVANETLGLPGGHGQNFLVLKDIYRRLLDAGKRFVYLGNVDNLGFTPDPAGLALLALTGKQAAFDFAFKTAVDVKGGILVVDDRGRLNCADIGPAVPPEAVRGAEAAGKRVLFNVAAGLFNLEYLVDRIDAIIDGLPMRWSDQDKDSGRYSQAEQITWEVIGLLDDILIFGVEKFRRFLAAKTLVENLMTSGLGWDDSAGESNPPPGKDFETLARNLHKGFIWNMENSYGMRLVNDKWEPAEDLGPSAPMGDA